MAVVDLNQLALLQSIDHEEQDRVKRFRLAWEAYEGDMPLPLKTGPGLPNDNVILPFVRTFVTTSLHMLFGDDLTMEGEDERADEIVNRSWSGGLGRGNRKMLTLTKVATNGGVTGQSFVKLQPKDGYVRVINLDPSYVSVTWNQEDFEDVLRYRLQWPIIDDRGKPAVRRQDTERMDDGSWIVIDYISRGVLTKWQEIGRDVWAFEFAPIVETQNLPKPNEYWGESDLDGGVLEINNAINAVISDVKRILRFHAHPKTIAKGVRKDTFGKTNVGPDGMLFLPEADQEIYNLEMQGDLASSLETYKALKEALHQVGSIPEVATGKLDSIGNLSARAMAILYKPAVDRNQTKRMTYGHLIDEVNRRILAIHGMDEDVQPSIVWPEPLPRDAIEERNVAEADLRMGITSKRTQASKLGYDWDAEQDAMTEEAQSTADALLTAFDRGEGPGAEPVAQPGA